ncbi:MAG: hypothetical protein E7Z91_06470 [Cyanobacteria bacterium SIG30]|nr:hypothetical protein [Cyanobacteria bacterium SIG30]
MNNIKLQGINIDGIEKEYSLNDFKGQKIIYCWVTPPRNQVDYADLSLIVNPEIGLKIEDEEFFIKMYFKKPDLKKRSG